jgi:hypothetical protein
MDEMDPQMSSVLAGRVALERLAMVDHEEDVPSPRRMDSLDRLARRSVALVAGLTWRRRSPTPAAGAVSSK